MTQEQIDHYRSDINRLQAEVTPLAQAASKLNAQLRVLYQKMNDRDTKFLLTCDHLNPDGTKALRPLAPTFYVCALCDSDLDDEFLKVEAA